MNAPGDLSVIGTDGLDMSAHISPSLTTAHLPTGRIGEFAATKLMALVRREPVTTETLLPVELIVRRSTGAIRSPR